MTNVAERIEAKIMGLEIALECEQAVIAYLLPYRAQFQARAADDMRLTRRNRQLLDSEHNARTWTQEIADLRLLLAKTGEDQ